MPTETSFAKLAQQWGTILATNHARSNKKLDYSLPKQVDQLTKGQHKKFRALVRELAFQYAHQVKADWMSFRKSLDFDVEVCAENGFILPSYSRGLIPD